jgi:hypothetical protein
MPRGRRPQEPEYDVVAPDAAAMIEALRAFGYDLPTAIAALVDNSISAGAKNIWLAFRWGGPDSHISVADDGCGMSAETLVKAMRAGSRSLLDPRAPGDLGRFGLGLKTASFSQCRRLTVASKEKMETVGVRRWDLDHVQKVRDWQLLRSAAEGSDARLSRVGTLTAGTVVLWEQMDRLVGGTATDSKTDLKRFLDQTDHVEKHLGMVFHRFLKGKQGVRIYINGEAEAQRVQPWDPFLEDEDDTIKDPPETLGARSGPVTVQAFVLPHHYRLTKDAHRDAAGLAGWNARQGFYVYRNQRLLVSGDWLGLGFTKEEHYKLARIRVDISNTADADWDIDVKKSTARPPGALRPRLRWIAEEVRKKAVAVYRHRGNLGAARTAGPSDPVWQAADRGGRTVYSVNRGHPLVRRLLELSKELKPVVGALLRMLEETVPVQRIWIETTEKPDSPARPFERVADKEVAEVIRQVLAALTGSGVHEPEAWDRIRRMDAFTRNWRNPAKIEKSVRTPATYPNPRFSAASRKW